jgi:hypothetical protein
MKSIIALLSLITAVHAWQPASASISTFDGPRYKSIYQSFREPQAAPAEMPESKGNVAAIRTEVFWDDNLEMRQGRMDVC